MNGLQWNDDGYAALSGALLDHARKIDAVFCAWADELGAAEYHFPSMIAVRDLAPIGYLSSFPHLATFVTSADRSETSLRTIASAAVRHGVSLESMETAEQLLTPAACYHFYPRFANSAIDAPLFLTTNCHCHRREDHYLPLQRQWCFQMREIVCIGDAESVESFTQLMAGKIDSLTRSLELETEWHVASDPFFDPKSDPKALAQMLEPTKKELCTPAGLAISSINRHRSFFGESYAIRFDGTAAHSACVAFGIERWLHAMRETHGENTARWPLAGMPS